MSTPASGKFSVSDPWSVVGMAALVLIVIIVVTIFWYFLKYRILRRVRLAAARKPHGTLTHAPSHNPMYQPMYHPMYQQIDHHAQYLQPEYFAGVPPHRHHQQLQQPLQRPLPDPTRARTPKPPIPVEITKSIKPDDLPTVVEKISNSRKQSNEYVPTPGEAEKRRSSNGRQTFVEAGEVPLPDQKEAASTRVDVIQTATVYSLVEKINDVPEAVQPSQTNLVYADFNWKSEDDDDNAVQ